MILIWALNFDIHKMYFSLSVNVDNQTDKVDVFISPNISLVLTLTLSLIKQTNCEIYMHTYNYTVHRTIRTWSQSDRWQHRKRTSVKNEMVTCWLILIVTYIESVQKHRILSLDSVDNLNSQIQQNFIKS